MEEGAEGYLGGGGEGMGNAPRTTGVTQERAFKDPRFNRSTYKGGE